MKRIIITECVGSGKTMLAKKVSRAFGIPHISTDVIVFDKNWRRRNVKDKQAKLREFHAQKN